MGSRQRTLCILHALYHIGVDRPCMQSIAIESQHLLSGGSITVKFYKSAELADRMGLLTGMWKDRGCCGGTKKDCRRRSGPASRQVADKHMCVDLLTEVPGASLD